MDLHRSVPRKGGRWEIPGEKFVLTYAALIIKNLNVDMIQY